MYRLSSILIIVLLVFIFSCEDQAFIITCSDCTADEPLSAELNAELDQDYFFEAEIQIWEGNLEDSILVGTFTAYNKVFTYDVVLNKRYTITAKYTLPDKQIIAVDTANPRVKYDKSQCDDPCYFIYDRKCNLKLKYRD
jgi:hypothetical protein